MYKKNLNSKLFFILYFLFEYKYVFSAVILPLNFFKEEIYSIKNNENNISNSTIIRDYYFNTLYTNLEIGTPSQSVSLIINSQKLDFKIFISYNKINNKLPYRFFNETNSKTYKIKGCKNFEFLEDIETVCESNDTFTYYEDINFQKKTKFDNFYFQLIKNTESEIPGELGLGPYDKNFYEENNIFKILKKNNLINTYYFYFYFNYWNDTTGKLIIGTLPHVLEQNKYSEDDLKIDNINIDSSTIREWKYEFNKIYINQNSLFYKKVELVFDSDLIIGTNELDSELDYSFFKNFTKNENFFEGTFKPNENLYLTYKFYYFDNNLKEILYKLIPSIKFESNDFDYTFEITKEELFIIKGNYIYFKVIFPITKQQDNFVLGRIFTLKYPFVFNPDLKQIGFYKKLINNKKKNFNYSTLIIIICIIIVCILLLMIGLKLGKYLYGVKRKQRANELEEDYEYNQNENKDTNNIGLIKESNDNEEDLNN